LAVLRTRTDGTQEWLTVETEDDFVVFLIGMRINALWRVHKWVPVFSAVPRMLKELSVHDDLGLLGYYRRRWGDATAR